MHIQNVMQPSQNFLSKTSLHISAQPQEETTRVERDKQERIAKKLELAGDGPAAVFIRSQQEEKESKSVSPRQKEIGKLQERIMQIQEKMTEIKDDETLTLDEKTEKLQKLDEQLAPLQEKIQKLQAEELEKFKAQKEEREEAEKKAEEKQQEEKATEKSTSKQSDAEKTAPIGLPDLDAGTLAQTSAGIERAESLLSQSEHLEFKATFWKHDLKDFIRHQILSMRTPPDPKIVARRRDEIFDTTRTADRLESSAADTVKEVEATLEKAEKSNGALPPKPNDIATEENDIRRAPYNAIGNAPAPKAAGTPSQSE